MRMFRFMNEVNESTGGAVAATSTTKHVARKRASKKAKKVAKKAAKVPAIRGHVYELTDKGRTKLDPKEISDQQVFILSFLKQHGGKARTADIADAASKDKKGFPCTQPHKRAVAYYMTDWKNQGFLRFAKAA